MNVNDAKLQNYGPQISGWLHEQVHYSVHCYNMKNNWHKLHRKISSSRPDISQWRNCLLRGNNGANKNQGNDRGLQETHSALCIHSEDVDCWYSHVNWPHLDHMYLPSGGDSQTEVLLLEEVKACSPPPYHLLANFHRSTIVSLMTSCCAVWFTSWTGENRKDLQLVVKAAEHIIGMTLYPPSVAKSKRQPAVSYWTTPTLNITYS